MKYIDTEIKEGDSVLVSREGSQIWINVTNLDSEDNIIGNHYEFEEPIIVKKEDVIDVFNEETTKKKIEEITFERSLSMRIIEKIRTSFSGIKTILD